MSNVPPSERLNGDDFAARGPEYENAWAEIVNGCEIPPSFEVFLYGFERASRKEWRQGLTVEKYASKIVKNYTRIR